MNTKEYSIDANEYSIDANEYRDKLSKLEHIRCIIFNDIDIKLQQFIIIGN